jgi:hypothetical protein
VSIGDVYPAHRFTFRRCDWPTIYEGSPDGYTRVSARIRDLPKPAAAPYNEIATFRAACDAIDVTFVLEQMAARIFTSQRLDLGRIYEVGYGSRSSITLRRLNYIPEDVLRFIPLPNATQGFYVLFSSHFAPFDAHCATGAPPH